MSHLILPSISDEDNVILILIPDEVEIRRIVFSIGAFKAPNLDSMPKNFYKSYWNTVGRDVICMVRLDLFLAGSLHQELNTTTIVLIPKVPDPTHLG